MKNWLRIELNPNRVYGLDILRAIAILIVVVEHSMYLLPKEVNKVIRIFSFDGVSIFFVLSGFLIGGIMIKMLERKKADVNFLKEFWVRRWLRTIPNYFLVLLFITGFYACTHQPLPDSLPRFFIFAQNLCYPHPDFFPEAWSLSVEEWFYILTPLLVFILIRIFRCSPKRSVLIAIGLVIVSVTALRLLRQLNITIEDEVQWNYIYRKQVITRLDSIMFGVIGAFVYFYYPAGWLKHKNRSLYLGIFLFVLGKIIYKNLEISSLYNCVFFFTLNSFATLLCLPYLSDLKRGEGVLYKTFTYVSLISYSMYLLNLTVVQNCLLKYSGWEYYTSNAYINGGIRFLLYWLLTIVLSILLYKYFEVPVLKWRDRKQQSHLS